jgi:hypothetical protein
MLLPPHFRSGEGKKVTLDLCYVCTVLYAHERRYTAPAGGLGDFFGPGTTVGIPFAAQLGLCLSF